MNGILRRGIGYIVAENSFAGSIGDNPVFFMANVELTMTPVVGYAENLSMLGSSYTVNDARPDRRMANLDITFKLDEDVFPLFLLNKYDIVTELVSGETTVYEHTASYNGRNVGTSYKFIFVDQDRSDEQYNGLVFSKLDFNTEANQYVTVQATARANYPVSSTIEGVITTTGEFVSRNMLFEMSDFGDSLATFKSTAFAAMHEFGEPDETDETALGELDRSAGFSTADRFSIDATALLPDYVLRDKWAGNQQFAAAFSFVDTTRFVSGSVTNVNPSVAFSIPSAKIVEWTNEGGADDLRKQKFTLLALNTPGVATSPHQITIINNVEEYIVSSS